MVHCRLDINLKYAVHLSIDTYKSHVFHTSAIKNVSLDVSSIIATEVVNSRVKVLTHHNRHAYNYEIFPTFYTNLLYHTSAKQTSSGLYAIHIRKG